MATTTSKAKVIRFNPSAPRPVEKLTLQQRRNLAANNIRRIDRLNNLNELVCTSCDEEFSPAAAVAKAAEQLKRWQAVARWVEMAADVIE